MASSRKMLGVLLLAAAVAAMAFLGVIAGNWYLERQRHREVSGKIERLPGGTATGLRKGDAFPDLPLVDLEGQPTTTAAVAGGTPSVVIFVSIHCETCTEAVLAWSAGAREVPPGANVFAIADNEREYVRVYAEKTDFPFPLYCDEAGRFGDEFDVTVYPTAVGVDETGRIAFVRHGFEHGYTLARAIEDLGVAER